MCRFVQDGWHVIHALQAHTARWVLIGQAARLRVRGIVVKLHVIVVVVSTFPFIRLRHNLGTLPMRSTWPTRPGMLPPSHFIASRLLNPVALEKVSKWESMAASDPDQAFAVTTGLGM
jgi:hypothetical protein